MLDSVDWIDVGVHSLQLLTIGANNSTVLNSAIATLGLDYRRLENSPPTRDALILPALKFPNPGVLSDNRTV